MLKVKRVDHVAVCVRDLDEAALVWRRAFGLAPPQSGQAGQTPQDGGRELVESQKTETLLLPVGDTALELIVPRGNVGLERFLERRGPGLHHIALEVEGIEEAIAFLVGLGLPMIDTVPRRGARGHKVAFVHPKATGGVLVELVETPDHP